MSSKHKSYGYICSPDYFAEKQLLHMLAMGYITDSRNFIIDRKSFPGHVVICCLSGRLHINQYDIPQELLPGSCCLLTLEDPHLYYSDTQDPCELLWVQFDGSIATDLLRIIFQNKKQYIIIQDSMIPVLLQNCISIYKNDTLHSEFQLSVLLYQILLRILEVSSANSNVHPGTGKTSQLSRKIDQFSAGRLNEKITLEQLAEHCHLSPSYFCRKFRAETGTTPMHYLFEKRIQMAKYLLIYTDDKLASIAEQLGFYDQNHFSLFFTKTVGCSPSKFRLHYKRDRLI